MAGGGHYYALRGLGDFWGFVAGAALLLDYTIDIALFAVASTGYVNFFLPGFGIQIGDFLRDIGPFTGVNVLWLAETAGMILVLTWLNIRGIRESSMVNQVIGAIDLCMEMSIIVFGLVLAWEPDLLLRQWTQEFPQPHQFMYGFSLAIISFVGLESISQAAQETRRPATIIPRTSIALIFTVFILAMGFSTVGLGILPWQEFRAHDADPVAYLATHIPYLGVIAGPFAAFLGATILFISSNTGVMGASRLVFSMSHFRLVGSWFSGVHPRFHTPSNSIVAFSLIGLGLTVIAFLTPSVLDTLANLYAFGATLGYMLVFISMIRLRFVDPYTPRPYKVPLNIKWRTGGRIVEVPALAILGLLGVSSIFVTVIITHEIGRIVGPLWIAVCLVYYAWYRWHNGLPVRGNTWHDWEQEQVDVLTDAQEFDSLVAYKQALNERDSKLGKTPRWNNVERSEAATPRPASG